MSPKRIIEVFTAGCPVCDEAVSRIKAAVCPDCDVTVYDLREGCETKECSDKADQYGITSVPAVLIDGKLVDCCTGRGVNLETLKQAGLGQRI